MGRIISTSFVFLSFSFAASLCRAQQASSVVQFLDRLAAASGTDTNAESVSRRNAENDQILREGDSFSTAPRAEIEASLPAILRYADDTSENVRIRGDAAMFLMVIAMRADGADLLSNHAADVAQLLTDSNPGIQHVAVVITDWVTPRIHPQQSGIYVTALSTAVRNPGTPQDVAAQMLVPLVRLGSNQPAVVGLLHTFVTRSDLNSQTKIDSIRSLAMLSDLPGQISQDMCTWFEDPDPQVRVAAIIAYSNAASQRDFATRYVRGEDAVPGEDSQAAALRSKAAASAVESSSTFVQEARKRVERIAADETENPKLRQLAKDALAGHTPLNPNILDPRFADPDVKPTSPQ